MLHAGHPPSPARLVGSLVPRRAILLFFSLPLLKAGGASRFALPPFFLRLMRDSSPAPAYVEVVKEV